jgi:hypothetical protein
VFERFERELVPETLQMQWKTAHPEGQSIPGSDELESSSADPTMCNEASEK